MPRAQVLHEVPCLISWIPRATLSATSRIGINEIRDEYHPFNAATTAMQANDNNEKSAPVRKRK
jgi:hypothetical protein